MLVIWPIFYFQMCIYNEKDDQKYFWLGIFDHKQTFYTNISHWNKMGQIVAKTSRNLHKLRSVFFLKDFT